MRSSAITIDANNMRSELRKRGAPHARGVDDLRLHKLLRDVVAHGGTIADAADSLIQWPRPAWVMVFCGPYPIDADDIATSAEWGPSGTAPT